MSFLAELRQVQPLSRTSPRAPSRQNWATPVRLSPPSSTSYPFAKAFAVAAVAYVAGTVALVYVAGSQAPMAALGAGSVGSAMSVFVVASVLPAIMVGMLARQSRRSWSVARMAAVYLPLFLLMAALQFGGSTAEAWWPAGMIAAAG